MTLEELTEAEAAASRLINALGLRDGAPQVVAVTSLTRQRAHTLFVQAYDDARRVVMFLRAPYDDADEIAPSLYAGRGNGRRKPEEEASAPTTPATPAGTHEASATNGHADAHPATQVPAGMPGGSPFANS